MDAESTGQVPYISDIDLKAELIYLHNPSEAPVSLSGWKVSGRCYGYVFLFAGSALLFPLSSPSLSSLLRSAHVTDEGGKNKFVLGENATIPAGGTLHLYCSAKGRNMKALKEPRIFWYYLLACVSY